MLHSCPTDKQEGYGVRRRGGRRRISTSHEKDTIAMGDRGGQLMLELVDGRDNCQYVVGRGGAIGKLFRWQKRLENRSKGGTRKGVLEERLRLWMLVSSSSVFENLPVSGLMLGVFSLPDVTHDPCTRRPIAGRPQ